MIGFETLLAENFAMKRQLQDATRGVAGAELEMARLRSAEQRFRALSQPTGAHGPVSEDVLTVARARSDAWPSAAPAPSAIESRLDELVEALAREEPEIIALIADLEALGVVQDALPDVWPAKGTITSDYGYRSDPLHGDPTFHHGVDIAARRGTPIVAVAAGTVLRASEINGFGKVIVLDHGLGVSSTYAHCDSHLAGVGDQVERGQVIATMGSTGRATGPHLHFELRLDGEDVDPLPYFPR